MLRHQSRGQLLGTLDTLCPQDLSLRSCILLTTLQLARDRIALLLDSDSPFLELCPFAGHGLPDSTPAANMITGIGVVR